MRFVIGLVCAGREMRLRCFKKCVVQTRQFARAVLRLLTGGRVAAAHAAHRFLEHHGGGFPPVVCGFEFVE